MAETRRNKKPATYVAITQFGMDPTADDYIAPGEVVNDRLDPEELERAIKSGTVALEGSTDDPNTWGSKTAPPAAPTVGESVAEQEKQLQRRNAGNVPPEVKPE